MSQNTSQQTEPDHCIHIHIRPAASVQGRVHGGDIQINVAGKGNTDYMKCTPLLFLDGGQLWNVRTWRHTRLEEEDRTLTDGGCSVSGNEEMGLQETEEVVERIYIR